MKNKIKQLLTTYYKLQTNGGFSFIELTIIVAVLAFLTIGPFIALRGERAETALRDTEFIVKNALERARSRATTGYGTSDHGVNIDSSEIETFENATCTPGSGVTTPLPEVTIGPVPTVICFKRLTGKAETVLPATMPVTITITNELGNSVNITVDENGTISE